VDDLCLLAQRRDPSLATLTRRPVLVLACAQRAVHWLLKWAGVEVADGSVILSLRDPETPASISAFLGQPVSLAPPDVGRGSSPLPGPEHGHAKDSVTMPPEEVDAWPAWFPIIDRQACVNCKQCLGFCLFGVYNLDAAGQVQVAQPRNCKNLCPACARLCPKGAIIFPKYSQPPVNGEPASEPAAQLPTAFSGDVIAELRRRAGQSPPEAQAIEETLRQALPASAAPAAPHPVTPSPGRVDSEKDRHGR
jgi:NAD-dependent dihydropyrimidine dehydrogenase PreA subunit